MDTCSSQPRSYTDDHWRYVLQSIGDAVIAADTDGRVICLNPAAETLTGWRQTDALGRDITNVYNLIEEKTGKSITRVLADVAKGGEVVAVKVDMVLVAREGKGTPVNDTAAPVRNEEQEIVGMVVVFRDNTAERQAWRDSEEARERLRMAVVEAHHRVKNNLNLVAALVELQANAEDDPLPRTAARRLMLHVRALSSIHELLTNEAWSEGADRLEARETLATLVPILQATVVPRLVGFSGDEVSLPPKYTTALSLIVNELVTNSVKHSGSDVEVRLSADAQTVTLEVTDDGPGFPPGFDLATKAHTGLELVERLATHDLKGRIDFGGRPEGGGKVTITFPLLRP